MIGLPGTGKTYYARNLVKEHPEKRYNAFGVQFLLEKMKVRIGNLIILVSTAEFPFTRFLGSPVNQVSLIVGLRLSSLCLVV